LYLTVFARKKNTTIWANEFRDDAGWSGWKTWGKPPAKLGRLTGAKYSPDACSWGGKRLDLFTCGVDSKLWHKWMDNKGVIHEWELLGGNLSSSPTATALVTWGRIDVCARFTDNKIYVNTLLGGHTPAGKWSGWNLLRESISSDSGPDACSMAGYLEVFAQNDFDIYSTWTGVKDWTKLPGPSAPKMITSDPSAVAWGLGNVSVFVRGKDNALWVRTRVFSPFTGSKLLDWQSWGGVLNSGPDACYSERRRLDVFARAADNTMLHMHRNDVEFPDVVVSEPIDDVHDWDSDPSAVAMFPDAHPPPQRPIIWEVASVSGIGLEPEGKAWHAGRVMDVLVWEYRDNPAPAAYDEVLIGAAHSGVWWIPSGTGYALPQSKDWDNPNVTCLASGPNAEDHFFAGCGNANFDLGHSSIGGALYETILSRGTPAHNWRKIPLKRAIGSITDIVVLKDERIIVLACWGGLFWSKIPATLGDKYIWNKADWKDAGVSGLDPACYGVTHGLNKDTKKQTSLVVAGAWDIKDPTKPLIRGIFVGTWVKTTDPKEPLKLSMKRATINPGSNISADKMSRVSVASCEKHPEYVYALSVDYKGTPNAVLRSEDGGKTWVVCSDKIDGDPFGNNVDEFGINHTGDSITKFGDNSSGGVIHHISVSPTDYNAVGFGVVIPFASFDGGNSWQILESWNGTKRVHTHDDVHCVYFDPVMAGRLFIASDGGLVSTTDNGKSFWSYYNKYLDNLIFLGPGAREFYGRISSSYALPGLIGGGLQDNGDVYLTTSGWKKITNGDGGQMLSILDHDFVYSYMNDSTTHRATFNAAKEVLEDQGPIPIKDTDGITKLAGSIPNNVDYKMEIVKIPQYKRAIWSGEGEPVDRSMYAVGATAADVPGCGGVKAFGLFANTDGSDTHWEPIINSTWKADTDHIVTAISSANGNNVFIATVQFPLASSHQLYVFSPNTGFWSNVTGGLPTTLPKGGSITRIVVKDGDTVAYAAYNIGPDLAHPKGRGFLLRTDNGGKDWKKVAGVPEEIIWGMDDDWSEIEDEWITRSKPLYLATDSSILVSNDEGKGWQDVSEGLPAVSHCMDLRFFIHSDGSRYLYLGTWGWSLWKALLPALWTTYPH
jgi:hypothetical protein